MSESHMRGIVVKALNAFDAVAVENAAFPGTPDVECTLGWIELKELGAWPKGADTPVLIPHFTPQQRIFLIRRTRVRGLACLLLKVDQEWLLFEGATAARIVGRCNRSELEINAVARWSSNTVAKKELASCLFRHHRSLQVSV